MPDNGRGLSALEKALMAPEPITSPNLEPLPASSSSKAAIRRCRAAWKRAFDFYIESKGDNFMTRKKMPPTTQNPSIAPPCRHSIALRTSNRGSAKSNIGRQIHGVAHSLHLLPLCKSI